LLSEREWGITMTENSERTPRLVQPFAQVLLAMFQAYKNQITPRFLLSNISRQLELQGEQFTQDELLDALRFLQRKTILHSIDHDIGQGKKGDRAISVIKPERLKWFAEESLP
jgi:hypothetical protein